MKTSLKSRLIYQNYPTERKAEALDIVETAINRRNLELLLLFQRIEKDRMMMIDSL